MSQLSDSSQFACGDAIENNFHYFYVCPLFIRHSIQLFNSLRKFQDDLNLDILLKGSPILTCIYRKTFQCYMTKYKEKENLLNHVNLLLPVMKWWTPFYPICTCLSQSQSLSCLDISPLIYLFVSSSSISPKFPLFNHKYIYWKRVNSYWYVSFLFFVC
jgi:hypothetical protein